MSFLDAAILFFVAGSAGALNSVAGGGSFLTFPTLIFLGVPPVTANATSTVALWPGSIASVGAYRKELLTERPRLGPLSIVSLVGGFLGARILLLTPQDTFRNLVPWLLLVATLMFAFGGPLIGRLKNRGGMTRFTNSSVGLVLGMALQLLIATYGGYFGGGIGILMLATLAARGLETGHAMNGIKNWLAVCINGVAVATFVIAGAVYWPQALVMLVGAIAGGYGGASTARRMNPVHIRRFVISVGATLTAYFFLAE